MDNNKPIAALFDLDGVILDTEGQYSIYWAEQGRKYRPDLAHFDQKIKGTTLSSILEYFRDQAGVAEKLIEGLNAFEAHMDYRFIPGVARFIQELRSKGVKTAVVTSSNDLKMSRVYQAHPHFKELFDAILTADMFSKSKPHPDCYLLGAERFDTTAENCVVFEDSLHGLEAGNRAGMTVIGLITTNPASVIHDKAHYIMPDFSNFNYEKMCALIAQFSKKA